jgi:hypothetical protein
LLEFATEHFGSSGYLGLDRLLVEIPRKYSHSRQASKQSCPLRP